MGSRPPIEKRVQDEEDDNAHRCSKQVAQAGAGEDASRQWACEERRLGKEQTNDNADDPGSAGGNIETNSIEVGAFTTQGGHAPGIKAATPDQIAQEERGPNRPPNTHQKQKT